MAARPTHVTRRTRSNVKTPSGVVPPTTPTRIFLDELAGSSAPKTCANYDLELTRRFLPFLASQGVTRMDQLGRAHCAAFLAGEARRGMSAACRRKTRSCLRRFLAWCVDAGYLDENPAEGIAGPPPDRSMRRAYTHAESRRMVRVAREADGLLGVRDYAIVLFLFGTGARAAELLGLTLDDLRSADYRANRRLLLHGKGGKDRYVVVGRPLARALDAWLRVRPVRVPADSLFVSARGTALNYATLAKLIWRLGIYADVKDCTPHRFRHTFATEHYLKNRDLMALKAALGHEEVATTEIYLRALGVDFELVARYPSPDEWLAIG